MRTGFAAIAASALLALTCTSQAAIIVDDSWADGGRNDGADALDANWWTSTTSSAIEVGTGSMGLVSGTSGRGIHGVFAPQTLTNVGDTLKVTFTFSTPLSVGSNLTNALKAGLYNTLGNASLSADLSASSGSPNALYNPIPGYMLKYDVNPAAATIGVREKGSPYSTGQLLASTTGYINVGSGGATYGFAANTQYVGEYIITKTAGGIDLTGTLSDAGGLLSGFTVSDSTPSSVTYDMLAFHANSNAFGSSTTVGAANNGIDFSNIKIETIVPEPTGLALLTAISCFALRRRV